jgi:hypothetical protein
VPPYSKSRIINNMVKGKISRTKKKKYPPKRLIKSRKDALKIALHNFSNFSIIAL